MIEYGDILILFPDFVDRGSRQVYRIESLNSHRVGLRSEGSVRLNLETGQFTMLEQEDDDG